MSSASKLNIRNMPTMYADNLGYIVRIDARKEALIDELHLM